MQILRTIAENQVTLIAGETGCGKTTQLPQMLFEEASARGEHCRVMCSQPRRLSAMSVAQRVAEERGDSPGAHHPGVIVAAAAAASSA